MEYEKRIQPDFKLLAIGSTDLMPPELKGKQGIIGQVNWFQEVKPGSINFVGFDHDLVKEGDIADDFEYLDHPIQYDLYPEMVIGNEQNRRIVMYGTTKQLSPELLYVSMFEVNKKLQGKALGSEFYKNLNQVAKNAGYKFIAGQHNYPKKAEFFLKSGRYLLCELKTEYLTHFLNLAKEELSSAGICTVQFLQETDIHKMVRPERLNSSVQDKVDLAEKNMQLSHLVDRLNFIYKQFLSKAPKSSQIKVMNNFCEGLLSRIDLKSGGLLKIDANKQGLEKLGQQLEILKNRRYDLLSQLDKRTLEHMVNQAYDLSIKLF